MKVLIKCSPDRGSFLFRSTINKNVVHLLKIIHGSLYLFCAEEDSDGKLRTLFNISIERSATVYNHLVDKNQYTFPSWLITHYAQSLSGVYSWYTPPGKDPMAEYAEQLLFGAKDEVMVHLYEHFIKYENELFELTERVH